MHVDFKITTWERVEIPENHEGEILEAIKSGKVKTANDIFDQFPSLDISCNKIHDVDEQMTPEENGGSSTIEVFEENGADDIWSNGD